MSKIPFTIRNSGRYYFRRRIRLENGSDFSVIIPLSTCKAQEARGRSAELAARFEQVKQLLNPFSDSCWGLDPDRIKALFESQLRDCLRQSMAEFHARNADVAGLVAQNRARSHAYKIAQRPGSGQELTSADEAEMAEAGMSHAEIKQAAEFFRDHCNKDAVCDGMISAVAEAYDFAGTDDVINMVKSVLLRANGEGHRLAAYYPDHDVQSADDQETYLMAKYRQSGPALVPVPLAPLPDPSLLAPEKPDRPFKIVDHRKFSEVVEVIINTAKKDGRWSTNIPQYRHVLKMFAWITADKPLCDYDFLDVEKFKMGLQALPKDFRPKKFMDLPFTEIAKKFEGVKISPRSGTTVNRDLSYMSTAHDILAKSAWAPKIPNTKALDFRSVYIAGAKKKARSTPRPPWTPGHMHLLFSGPIWHGGGGHLKRLNLVKPHQVFQDAAYWMPLLLYYSHCRPNEIAGLKCDEIEFDCSVPFIIIQDNDLRGLEDELTGEKTPASGRMVPIHDELLELGFKSYVAAIQAEGHDALFPELYSNAVKRGRDHFYAVAWKHIFEWIDQRMPSIISKVGKKSDMHSFRSLGSSFYSLKGIPEHILADLMGHARTGTNALHYSNRWETHGRDAVLSEVKELMTEYVANVTANLPRVVPNLLPLAHRSRVGMPRKK